MKYILTLLLVILVTIISCNTRNQSSVISKPGEVVADEYKIETGRDTILQTKNGALLNIPAGSLSGEGSVTLEIKEAYTIDQMIFAGLTTSSNGQPLSSGGMIYINAKENDVNILKPIQVSLPTEHLEDGMKLFQGEKDSEGNINWTNPSPLPPNPITTILDTGKVLFENRCASCHAIGKDMTGPDLAHFLKRYQSDKLLVRGYSLHSTFPYFYRKDGLPIGTFSKDTALSESVNTLISRMANVNYELLENQMLYECNIYKKYGAHGQLFDLGYDEITSIYRYIQNESDKLDLPMPSIAYLDKCIDSCMVYNKMKGDLNDRKARAEEDRDDYISGNENLVKVVDSNPQLNSAGLTNSRPINNDDKKVIPEQYEGVYYQFTVSSFGWFNIDVLLDEVEGVKESELFVKIAGDYREKVSVFLIIPSHKVYGQGGPADRDPDDFAFFLKSGKIPLPQGAQAYILAMSESESEASIVYSIQPFVTSLKQEITVSLKSASKDEFRSAIMSLNLDRLHIEVDDSKNATEIRKTDTILRDIEKEFKKLEPYKPKNCDCDCSTSPASEKLGPDSLITRR